jgi:hypothetical protein
MERVLSNIALYFVPPPTTFLPLKLPQYSFSAMLTTPAHTWWAILDRYFIADDIPISDRGNCINSSLPEHRRVQSWALALLHRSQAAAVFSFFVDPLSVY